MCRFVKMSHCIKTIELFWGGKAWAMALTCLYFLISIPLSSPHLPLRSPPSLLSVCVNAIWLWAWIIFSFPPFLLFSSPHLVLFCLSRSLSLPYPIFSSNFSLSPVLIWYFSTTFSFFFFFLSFPLHSLKQSLNRQSLAAVNHTKPDGLSSYPFSSSSHFWSIFHVNHRIGFWTAVSQTVNHTQIKTSSCFSVDSWAPLSPLATLSASNKNPHSFQRASNFLFIETEKKRKVMAGEGRGKEDLKKNDSKGDKRSVWEKSKQQGNKDASL